MKLFELNPLLKKSSIDPDFRLLPPRVKQRPPSNLVQRAIAPSLATQFGTTVTNIRSALTYATIEQYGALKRIDSEEGDTIRCASLYKPPRNSRDPTFVRVSPISRSILP